MRQCGHVLSITILWALAANGPLLADEPQRDGNGEIYIQDLAAGDECNAAVAEPVALLEFARDPDRFYGRCISTSGVVSGWRLVDDIDGLYAFDPGASGVGMYPQSVTADLPGASRAEVVGVAGTCESLHGPGVIMVLGYCHHYPGPYVAVAKLTPKPPLLPRLVGERDRRRVGNLARAPSAWRELSIVVDLAQEWMRSIQQDDIAAFAHLEHRSAGDLRLDDPEAVEHAVFTAPDSAFAQFRGSSESPQLAVFVGKRPGARRPRLSDVKESQEAYACFCREDDCEGRWPISTVDATNDDRRPFVCARIYQTAKPELWVVITDVWRGDLVEP